MHFNIIRWILFIPGACTGFMLSLSIFTLIPFTLIPGFSKIVVLSFFGAMGAFLVVIIGSLIAPSYRRVVACILFLLGGIIAALLFYVALIQVSYKDPHITLQLNDIIISAIATYTSGLFAVVIILRREKTRKVLKLQYSDNTSFLRD